MKILSLIENQHRLIKAEIEIQLLPGIPQIHFLGLADKQIKESFFRIKAALKSSGFKFPINQQVIVNINPTHLRKSSVGLELAVAVGLLELTGQKNFNIDYAQTIVYGELELGGHIRAPDNLFKYVNSILPSDQNYFLTGQIPESAKSSCQNFLSLPALSSEIETFKNQGYQKQVAQELRDRNDFLQKSSFSNDEAEIIFLMATTGSHVLLSGAAGSGKTYLAQSLKFFLPASKKHQPFKTVLSPHHSITVGGFLGGGSTLYSGDIERVQDGLLIMDEFLEFNQQIIELLRGPMLGGTIELSRAGTRREFSNDFQVAATTNLCPCGKWIPKDTTISCRFSRTKCQRYLDRLSGPILDRFGLFYFYPSKKQKRVVPAEMIFQRIKNFYEMSCDRHYSELQLNDSNVIIFEKHYADIPKRREFWLKKIAQVYAFEAGAPDIKLDHLKKAAVFAVDSFAALELGHC